MKVLVFLSICILLSQAHVPDFTDFFKKFVSRLPMKTELKAEIENNGLVCLNLTSQIISQDFTISSVKELLETVHIVEDTLFPRCLKTYNQIISFFEENANLSQINTPAKAELFNAKLIQIGARVFIELFENRNLNAAQDLTLFLETAFGLIRVYLPPTLELNSTRYTAFNLEKALPPLLKGFFVALGVQNEVKINNTIQCIQGISQSIEPILSQRGDSWMMIIDAFERCDQLETINFDAVKSFIETVKSHPGESFLKMAGSAVMQLPTMKQSEINMKVYLKQGDYELAGQQFALILLSIYEGILL